MTATDPTSIDERNKIRCGVCGTPWDCHPADTICCRHRPAPPRVRKRVRVPVERGLEPVPEMRVFGRTLNGKFWSYTIIRIEDHTLNIEHRLSSGKRYWGFMTPNEWRRRFHGSLKICHIVAVTVPNAEVSTYARP